MFLVDFLRKLFAPSTAKQEIKSSPVVGSIYGAKDEVEEIHSIWDYIKMNEHTQAAHISSVLGFDEWISMEEILRRIREIFGMDYKNDRSLYPYIKTLVDVGLIETSSAGGKKKWRKRDVLIKLKGKKQVAEEEEEQIRAENKAV